jgi:hypothetical protein
MIIAGIDYSLSCPAICVHDTQSGKFSFKTTSHYFRSNLKKFDRYHEGKIWGENHGAWKSDEDRYDDIATWALNILTNIHQVDKVLLEGYSYGSTGKVFHIAENTAILKYNLWDEQIPFSIIPPTVIKKFATGKGNANKEKMYEEFVKENPGVDLRSDLTPRSSNVISPVNDIVDAYFIAKFGLNGP